MFKKMFSFKMMSALLFAFVCSLMPVYAGEADLIVPDIKAVNPDNYNLLLIGIGISVLGLIFGFIEFLKIKSISVFQQNRSLSSRHVALIGSRTRMKSVSRYSTMWD